MEALDATRFNECAEPDRLFAFAPKDVLIGDLREEVGHPRGVPGFLA